MAAGEIESIRRPAKEGVFLRHGSGGMDLNYYLQREQVELTRAAQATHRAAAEAHRGLADLYRTAIEGYRSAATGMDKVTSIRL